MNKTLYVIIAAVASILLFAYCRNEENMNKIAGTWIYTQHITQDELPVKIDFRLILDNDNTGRMTLSKSMPDYPEFVTISSAITWSATGENLMLTQTDADPQITFSPTMHKLLAEDPGGLEAARDEMRKQWLEQMQRVSAEELVSISDKNLVVRENGQKLSMTRVK